MTNRLPDFTHNHLNFKKASIADVPLLMAIGDSWKEKVQTEGEAFEESYLIDTINNASLPPIPEAREDHFGIYLITDSTKNDLPIGLLELYFGYPDPETLWIALFIVDEKHRRNHYGYESVQAMKDFAKSLGATHLGIGVSLKNWRGMHFWHAVGFNSITKVVGETVFTPEGKAMVSLKMPL